MCWTVAVSSFLCTNLGININLFVSIKRIFLSRLENHSCSQSASSIIYLPATSWPPTPFFPQYTLGFPLKLSRFPGNGVSLGGSAAYLAEQHQTHFSSRSNFTSLIAATSTCVQPQHRHAGEKSCVSAGKRQAFSTTLTFFQRQALAGSQFSLLIHGPVYFQRVLSGSSFMFRSFYFFLFQQKKNWEKKIARSCLIKKKKNKTSNHIKPSISNLHQKLRLLSQPPRIQFTVLHKINLTDNIMCEQ